MNNKLLDILDMESKEISASFEKSRKEGVGTPQEVADRNESYECFNTVPAFIFAEETYKNIETLLDNIAEYYIQNKVPHIEQFDLLLVNNRVLIYNFRPNMYISWGDKRMLAFYEGGEKCLASFLLQINEIPQSAPKMSDDVMEIYLKEARPAQVLSVPKIDWRLKVANV